MFEVFFFGVFFAKVVDDESKQYVTRLVVEI